MSHPLLPETQWWAMIARQVRAARKTAGLSQGEIAARIGTSISAISRLESARGRPTVRTLIRLAQETGASFLIAMPVTTPDPAPEQPEQSAEVAEDQAEPL